MQNIFLTISMGLTEAAVLPAIGDLEGACDDDRASSLMEVRWGLQAGSTGGPLS